MAKLIKKEDRPFVYHKYNGKCAYCGINIKFEEMHVDHIIPIFRGSTEIEVSRYNREKGKNKIDNYSPSCISCNCSKSTFTVEQWRNQIKHKIVCLRRDTSNFRILERFGIISVNEIDIKFYFEKESEVHNG